MSADNAAEKAAEYFSPTLLEGENLLNREVAEQLAFHEQMTQQRGYGESGRPQGLCLSVYGANDDGDDLSFNLRYVEIANRLLIDEIEVLYDNLDEVEVGEVLCPGELLHRPFSS